MISNKSPGFFEITDQEVLLLEKIIEKYVEHRIVRDLDLSADFLALQTKVVGAAEGVKAKKLDKQLRQFLGEFKLGPDLEDDLVGAMRKQKAALVKILGGRP